MRKISSLVTFAINTMYVLVFLGVFINNLLFSNLEYINNKHFNNYILVSIGIIVIIALYFMVGFVVNKTINVKLKIKSNYIFIIWTVILSLIIFFLAYNYSFKTGWDSETIQTNAQLMAEKRFNELNNVYYSLCPNNVLITSMYSVIYHIFTNNAYIVFILINSVIYAWTGFFIYKIALMYFKESRYPIIVYIVYVALIGLSPWVVIPYSDSLGLGIVTLCVFLFFKICEYDKYYKLYLFALTLLSVFGYYIKPQIVIFTIATLIFWIVNIDYGKIKYDKKIITNVMIVVISAIMTLNGIKLVFKTSGFQLDKELQLDMTHFLMMGWNKENNGVYSVSDLKYSVSFQTPNERKKAQIKEFTKRVKELTPKEFVRFVVIKTLINYNDGTFAWGDEGGFYRREYDTGFSELRHKLKEFYWTDYKYNWIFNNTMQTIWIIVLLLNIFSKNNDKRIQTLKLAILGLTLFELLFEARARYLFIYSPIYDLIGVVGLFNISKTIETKRRINK